jgi:hypothetical protein
MNNVEIKGNGPPKVFISYSWDDETHLDWVRGLATDLRLNGIDALLDQWSLTFGKDIGKFMEECAESSRVIVVCTPKYKKKASNPEGGVGYEKIILTSRIMKNLSNDEVIPLLRKGDENTAIPTFLSGRLYVDFRDGSNYKNQLEELVKQILGFIPWMAPLWLCSK